MRALWVRIQALPPEAPLWAVLAEAEEKAKAAEQVRAVDDALAMFR